MLELYSQGSLALYAEIALILSVFFIQVYFFIRTRSDIKILRNVFSQPLRIIRRSISTDGDLFNLSEEELEEMDYMKEHIEDIVLLSSKSDNEINIEIKESINTYLVNNRGAAVNYSIIKDIVDREIDAKDEEVAQAIPIPLYLGLAATIIGIIFGLFATPDLTGNSLSGNDLSGFNALIDGVKIAMFASLSGLGWTIILSSFMYKSAQKTILRQKNKQLSYLQSNLLPELHKAEDAGVVGLKNSIDQFSRFADGMVKSLHEAIDNSRSNIELQQQTLNKIEDLNVTKVSKVNLELFNRLEQNMESFHKFSEFIGRLDLIAANLQEFSTKTESIDEVAHEIKSTLNESKQLTRFLSDHLEHIEEAGDKAIYAVDRSEKQFTEAIDKLNESTADKIEGIQELSDDIEQHFNKVYDLLFTKLDEVAGRHVDRLAQTYDGAVPKFEKLDYLSELEVIKEQLSETLKNGDDQHDPEMQINNEKLSLVNDKLNEISHLLLKLEQNTRKNGVSSARKPGKPLSRWAAFKNWFKKPFKRN